MVVVEPLNPFSQGLEHVNRRIGATVAELNDLNDDCRCSCRSRFSMFPHRREFLRWLEGSSKVLRSSPEMLCMWPVQKLGDVIISLLVMTILFEPYKRGGALPS